MQPAERNTRAKCDTAHCGLLHGARASAGLVLDLYVGPRSRRSRVSHASHVRVPRPRSPSTHNDAPRDTGTQ
eukprot:7167274-Prymnesium_polylepis.2